MTWNLASGLDGKRVMLTGGAGGIGREVALAFGGAGSRVAVIDLDKDKVEAVVAVMTGGPHLPLAADLRPVAGHAELIRVATEFLGGLDVLVCTAAVLVRRYSVDEVTEADWDIQHDVNLKSTFFLIRQQRGSFARRAGAAALSTSHRRAGRAAGLAARSLTPPPRAASSR